MMHYVSLLCLLCYLMQPSLQQGGNSDLDDVLDEIIAIMSTETDGVSSDNKYEYVKDPDLFIPPSVTFQQSMEANGLKDYNGIYEYNPFAVWETRESFMDNDQSIVDGAKTADAILQAIAQSTGDHLNYHIVFDDTSASLQFYDVPFAAHVEAYPALFSISLDGDFCSSATTDDAHVVVQYFIAGDKHSCPEPEVQVTKEMFVNLADHSSACRPINGSACDCYKPDTVTSTSGFTETGQFAKPTVTRPGIASEAWFTKLQPYYQMLMEMYTSYDMIVSQIHQSLEAISTAPFCCFNDMWYEYGDVILIPDDPCLHCVCDEHWTGPDNCTTIMCPLSEYEAETGDDSIEVIQMPGSCCGIPKSIISGNLCSGITACEPGGTCESLPGDFTCTCFEGYVLAPDGKGCNDTNECDDPDTCPNGECTNLEGSFRCDCDPGFRNPPDNQQECQDVDECSVTPERQLPPCDNGQCENTVGDFTCTCNDGYQNPSEDNLKECVDIDECNELEPPPCPNGECVNAPGDFTCTCNDGYQNPSDDNLQECVDHNECLDPAVNTSICDPTKGECRNEIGAPWTCECDDHHVNDPDDLQICIDFDECSNSTINTTSCVDGVCENIVGAPWICGCNLGFENPVDDQQTCNDIDECERDPTLCANGECTNTPGSFNCSCNEGFQHPSVDDDQECVDIDECNDLDSDTSSCTEEAGGCVNRVGSWECVCNEGYEQGDDQFTCVDIDECNHPDVDTSSCTEEAGNCTNLPGTWGCSCNEGYERGEDDFTCVDIDECTDLDTSSCTEAAGECVNQEGTWECSCYGGYEQEDLFTCVDVDECSVTPERQLPPCENGQCGNTVGDFTCTCNDGYQNPSEDNLKECVDIDECTDLDTSSCTEAAGECVNQDGTWECSCHEGYEQEDPFTCVDIDECNQPDVDTSSCTEEAGSCTNSEGSWGCSCNEGYEQGEDQFTCVDINECANDPGLCVPNGRCENIDGGFECDCDLGFDEVEGECVESDMCVDPVATCGLTATCIDGPGTLYVCQCPEGQIFIPDSKECLDEATVQPTNTIQRTYTATTDSESFLLNENTLLLLQNDVPNCPMYFEITFPGLDLGYWHQDNDDCSQTGTVRKEPYISVHDEYLDPDNDIRYCRGDGVTIRSLFLDIKIRVSNAGQDELDFPIQVRLFKGPGKCCGGYLDSVPETENPFNQLGIKSPDYPFPYSNNEWCSWIVRRPPGTTGGGTFIYVVDWNVVVTVDEDEESSLDCLQEDALFVSGTKSLVGASAMCGSFPEWGKRYDPDNVFLHWRTNSERVTRGFQAFFFYTEGRYGVTEYERGLERVCGEVKTETGRKKRESGNEDDSPAVHVPIGMSLPKRQRRVKRVTTATPKTVFEGEVPFLVVVPVLRRPYNEHVALKFFFAVLIADNFVVASSHPKDFQKEDPTNRKIRMYFGVHDFQERVTGTNAVAKSALRFVYHEQCDAIRESGTPAVDPTLTNWEYTDSVLGACPMLMVSGKLSYTDYIQPAFFPWYTFPWLNTDSRMKSEEKRLFHVGWQSNDAGDAVREGVVNIPRRVSMQKTRDKNCLEPIDEDTIAPHRLCTAATNAKGACQGDVGSPVLKRMYVDDRDSFSGIQRHWTVMGILVKAQCGTTVTNAAASGTMYQAYIEINSYLSWMQQIMMEEELLNCRRPLSQWVLDNTEKPADATEPWE